MDDCDSAKTWMEERDCFVQKPKYADHVLVWIYKHSSFGHVYQ